MLRYLLAGLLAASTSNISIQISPRVLLAGQSLNLTCRVAKDPRNRILVFGVVGSERERSERQLDGDKAPITWGPTLFMRIPCGAGPAYCAVIRNDGSFERSTQPLEVAGCEP